MYSFEGLFGEGTGGGGGGEKNIAPTLVLLKDDRHGPAAVARPRTAIRQMLPTTMNFRVSRRSKRRRCFDRVVFFLRIATSFRVSGGPIAGSTAPGSRPCPGPTARVLCRSTFRVDEYAR